MEKQNLDVDNSFWEPLKKKNEDYIEKKPKKRHSYLKIFAKRFLKNKLAMLGLSVLAFLCVLAIIGPMMSPVTYDKTNLDYVNLPPSFDIYKIGTDGFVFIHPDYYLVQVKENGEILKRLKAKEVNQEKRNGIYELNGHELVVDYGHYARNQEKEKKSTRVTLACDGKILPVYKHRFNKTYIWGTDILGRDMFTRTMYSARNSLMIAITATFLNTLIGVFVGSLAGYSGGLIDTLIMRLVDALSTIPMLLIVIMLMVVMGPGIGTVIFALGISNWISLARIVRSQVLSLREREFVLASRIMNGGKLWILRKHLIPNILPSVITCMSLMLPDIIFTESFLSFIGLGTGAASVSWGTMVSDGLEGMKVFPYQLIIPVIAVCLATLSFNFIGKAMESAMISQTN